MEYPPPLYYLRKLLYSKRRWTEYQGRLAERMLAEAERADGSIPAKKDYVIRDMTPAEIEERSYQEAREALVDDLLYPDCPECGCFEPLDEHGYASYSASDCRCKVCLKAARQHHESFMEEYA